jgi:hypothetical protein
VVLDLWKKRSLYLLKKGADRCETLLSLFERGLLYRAATKAAGKHLPEFDLIATDVAELLAAEGLRDLAARYLQVSANDKQANVAITKDRIFKSDTTGALASQFSRPQFPYQLEKV